MKILVGDILQSTARTLINTVNCVGVMGKGIALEFKNRFPDMYEDYLVRCKRGEVKPGLPFIYRSLLPPQIINFPTKDHWKSVSKVSDIDRGLKYLLAHYQEWGVQSLAIPPLGCGNGQLEWRVVGPLIYRYAKQMNVPVEMYAPYGTNPRELTLEFVEKGSEISAEQATRNGASTALEPSWVALVEVINRIEQHPYHWPIGRVIFQKIAYVATDVGLPTGLNYKRSSFGPFSAELKNVEVKLINSGLLQEERHGKMFMVKVGPNFSRVRNKYEQAFERWSKVLDKVVDLFMRVDTNQAEVIATVLFAARELARDNQDQPSERDVLQAVMQWKQRRRPPLDEVTVGSAIRDLGMLRWLNLKASPDLPLPEEEAVAA
ncbi:MAG: Appr-1-p processing protein [Betaproteobacteria bacterium RIFCSPLOWO2_02_64_14]|nr:MAG: Appr-1-p processing protein [Betaproteobacteria bacterium RIFCSPLOWO2_02_64_14]